MIFPVKYSLKVFGTDSFDLSLTWKDPSGNIYDLSSWLVTMTFFVSKDDRTVVKSVDSTTTVPESRIELAATAPNIYVFIQSDETLVGPSGFLQTPGYYTLDVGPQDAQLTMDRLMEGRIKYEP